MNLRKPPSPQAKLIATEIIGTVHKHQWGVGGGGGRGRYFKLNFGNRPNIFGQDCSFHLDGKLWDLIVALLGFGKFHWGGEWLQMTKIVQVIS